MLIGHSMGYLLGKYVASINDNVKCLVNIDCNDRTYSTKKTISKPPSDADVWKNILYYT